MKILLVEDSQAIAFVMTSRLNSFGFEVVLAANGKIAVDMFAETSPDLILMDIEMPVMNGFEATNRIRAYETTQKWAWTPIIFLTASDTLENLVTAIESGADDFLSKTVPEPVLHAKMKAMARIATLRRRLFIANRKLEYMASRDGLTGLFNRRHMDMEVDFSWDEALRKQDSFAVLMLDIDNFKKYNDSYGHQAGDDCLRKVAEVLGRVVDEANAAQSQGAFAARYGGEEFAVVLPNATAGAYADIATLIIEGIRKLQIKHENNAGWNIVTASIGGERLDKASNNIAEVFRAADARLYHAKENGRNRAELEGKVAQKNN